MSLFPLFFSILLVIDYFWGLEEESHESYGLFHIPPTPFPRWPWASLICIVMEIGIKPGEAQASCCTRWQNPVIFLLGGQGDYNLFEDLSAPCDNRSPNVNRQLWELKMSKTFIRGFHLHAHTQNPQFPTTLWLGPEREKKILIK